MTKYLLFFFLVIIIISCNTEEEAGPANDKTFLRYFGSEFSHIPLSALEANEGFTMLSNIDIPTSGLGDFMSKARIIHTDHFGNILWDAEYPSWEDDPWAENKVGGFKASSFITTDEGYLLIGERIYSRDKSALQLLAIDAQGSILDSLIISGEILDTDTTDTFIPSIHGRAVTAREGNFVVLASVTGLPNEDMMVAEINSDLGSTAWYRTYGDGITTILSRVFSYPTEILWGGTYQQTNQTQPDFRIVQTPPGISSEYAPTFGLPGLKETASDMCETIGGFAFIGTCQEGSSARDMIVTTVSKAGVIINTQQIDFAGGDDQGNAISRTDDGNLIVLGTVRTTDTKGNGGTDFFLKKLAASGHPIASFEGVSLGGPNNEEGACVLETSDGSFLIYGSTTFGSLKKLVLMKVNDKGEL